MQEKKRHILKEAIADLSNRKAPEILWEGVRKALDQEQGRNHLADAVTELEVSKAAPEVWEGIEEKLKAVDHEARLKKAIDDLPEYQYNEKRFNEIIERAQTRTFIWRSVGYWASGVAAVLIIAWTMVFVNRTASDQEQVTMSYSDEWQTVLPVWELIDERAEEDEVMAFVKENCQLVALKCESPRFQGLLDEYIELDTARLDLVAQIDANQEQSQLVNYLVRVEKAQNEVGKKLIQIIIS